MTNNVTTPLGPVKTTTLYAVVDKNGNLLRGVGAVKVVKVKDGKYKVTFNVDVTRGCFNATIVFQNDGTALFAMAKLSGTTSVDVRIFNKDGEPTSGGFYFNVTTAYAAQSMKPVT